MPEKKVMIKDIDNLYAMLNALPEQMIKDVGEKAMEFIGDYPLYASGLSNITYEEAILVAMVLGKEL